VRDSVQRKRLLGIVRKPLHHLHDTHTHTHTRTHARTRPTAHTTGEVNTKNEVEGQTKRWR
jgi:hypothetical protein